MANLPNLRRGNDLHMVVTLTDSDVEVDWTTVTIQSLFMIAESQRYAFDGKCTYYIDSTTTTNLHATWPAASQLFLGAHRLVLQCSLSGANKTYDARVINVIEMSDSTSTALEEQEVEIEVDEVDTSIMAEILAACQAATVLADTDHTTAASDHTTAAADHTTAVSDHTTLTTLLAAKVSEPASEGTSGQVLTTDGNGGRSWANASSGTTDFEQLTNRPKYNGSTMDKDTDIPEVKTSTWDGKQDALDNADLLETYEQTEANLADAVSKKHSHDNQSVLDGITQSNLVYVATYGSTTIDDLLAAYQAGKELVVYYAAEYVTIPFSRFLSARTTSGVRYTFTFKGTVQATNYTITLVTSSGWTVTTSTLQNAISDLSTIRSGAAAGATAIQEPASEGTSGQVLTTDGDGGRSWATVDVSDKEASSNKVTSLSSSSTDTQYPSAKCVYDELTELDSDISAKESSSNKVTSLSASSTDTQYPSAKCVYDELTELDSKIGEIEEETDDLRTEEFGDVKARSLDLTHLPTVCGVPMVILADGAPAIDTVPYNWDESTMGRWSGAPYYIGQMYINMSGSKVYIATDTSAVASWKAMN